ncbi:succinic semialdehyde dehydrogenase [Corynebacterium sp. SCR221107]|uniref:succinic semialdehyde dehydrogenase n=1 Tax=Corynebacterium sp. SCR221107 TaxID=3017361 RepID=UPI003FA45203
MDTRGRVALARLIQQPEELVAEANGQDLRAHTAALTGAEMGSLPQTPAERIAHVFEHARSIQSDWAETSFAARRDLMLRFHDLLLDEREAMLDLIQWETAKSRASAFEEVADVAINARYYARTAHSTLRDRKTSGAVPLLTTTTVSHRPRGVVAVISPWNYPLTLSASDALAAIMAGNAIVIKPDSLTPYTALAVKSLLERAGFPRDLFQIVLGAGATLGTPMIDAADYVMFTGSSATGATIAERAGRNLIGVSAELGGKNPMIVRADAPIAKTAAGALKACFSNSGQLCISIERIYVHTDIWDAFVPELVRRVEKMSVRAAMDWEVDMGPLISESQFNKVSEHVDDAVAKGARILAGGKPAPEAGPRGFRPTLLTDVTEEMAVFGDETFGPVVSLYRVGSDEEAIAAANAAPYGLNASVWTADLREGERVAARIRSGMVNVNDGYAALWGSIKAPSGGVKSSGLSHRHGKEGITKYTDLHVTATQRILPVMAPRFVSERAWSRFLTGFVRVQRALPGVLFGEK